MPRHDGTPTRAEARAANRAKRDAVNATEYAATHAAEADAGKELRAQLSQLARVRREALQAALASGDAGQLRSALMPEEAETGRPSDFTPEEGEAFLAWIASGKSLVSYCAATGRSVRALFDWFERSPAFAQAYSRARASSADRLAEQIIDIADEAAVNPTIESVAAAKLRVEARKWIAAKLKPSVYGERIEVENKGTVSFQIGTPRRATATIDQPAQQLSGPDDTQRPAEEQASA